MTLVNTPNRIGNELCVVRKGFCNKDKFEKYGERTKKTGFSPTDSDGNIKIFEDEERLLELLDRKRMSVDSVRVGGDVIECIENKDAELLYFKAGDIEHKVYLSHLKTIHNKLKPKMGWRMNRYVSEDNYILGKFKNQEIILVRGIASF